MFSLPNEMKLHIYSYLPPLEVRRFHRLNSHFKRLTEERPADFKKLSIEIAVHDRPLEQKTEVEITTPAQIFRCDIVRRIDEPRYTVRKIDDEARVEINGNDDRTKAFFSSWLERCEDDDYNICDYFNWLFTMANIKLEVDLNLETSVQAGLLIALSETTTRIERFTLNMENYRNIFKVEDIMKYVRLCSRNGMPELNVKENVNAWPYNSDYPVQNYNCIAKSYPNLCVDFKLEQVCGAARYFVRTWSINPGYSVNFKLRFYGNDGCAQENWCFFKKLRGKRYKKFKKNHMAKHLPNKIKIEIDEQTSLRMTFTKRGPESFFDSTIHFDN